VHNGRFVVVVSKKARRSVTVQPAASSGAVPSAVLPLAVAAEGLAKTYPGGVEALKGVSFGVRPGAVFALLGPNGAGKSTIVKILTTLSRPTAGRASIVGRDVVRDPERVRRVIGLVAQKSAVDLEATAAENLTLQGQLYGLSGAELRRRVSGLLERFDLADARKRIARTLSGGMQRKLDVAMGLIHQPEVLFLDEPTTGLDPEARADMWREIARLARADGLTVVLTTHYLEEADHLAQHVAIIDHGQIVVEGTPEGLKAELRGDAIQVELADAFPETNVRAALGGLDGVLREVTIDRRSLRARVDSGASALPAVLAALDAAGIRAATATVARPSLDDVYLRHTGHAYSEGNNKGAIR
jgi:ABC-2 type transport system ATP-binding protein